MKRSYSKRYPYSLALFFLFFYRLNQQISKYLTASAARLIIYPRHARYL
ncbi:hypothetical protein BN1221_03876c [Brenneria goodwinii]|uniref:Uncharacterized protein n=1 Tax=Brenneria goodwinii TaxID=1109412 RepID=A0A0G4JZM2_9GAMM|nr:hypothetical protein BN1221_03876c [Brenneria goodwinii]